MSYRENIYNTNIMKEMPKIKENNISNQENIQSKDIDMDITKEMQEIMQEIIAEEKIEEERRKEILAKGCPCTNKVERIGFFSKIKFLECPICFKQYNLDGTPIEW